MIVIVAAAGIGFPNGTAPTARVTGYARGLKANGAEVLVLCLGASELNPAAVVNTKVRGVARGIPFEYTGGSTIYGTNVWRRRWDRLWGLMGAVRRIRQLRAVGAIDAILLYSPSSLDAAVLRFVSRQVGAVYIVDVCEMPFHHLHSVSLGKVRRSVYDRTFFRWFDAAIVISEPLRNHVSAFGSADLAVLRVPVIVDTDEFHPLPDAVASPPLVMYCGLLNQEKDGVISLMKAFCHVEADLRGIHLMLVGDSLGGTRIPEFRAVAENLGTADKVTFAGTVARSEVPARLAQASVLVLARPRSLQTEAGMPTKVAEYLASGVPTVLTRVGEITAFLENGVSAYLVPPDDVPALAAALRHVLLQSAEAADVGRCGREVAVQNFDYRVVGAQVAAFIADLRAIF